MLEANTALMFFDVFVFMNRSDVLFKVTACTETFIAKITLKWSEVVMNCFGVFLKISFMTKFLAANIALKLLYFFMHSFIMVLKS